MRKFSLINAFLCFPLIFLVIGCEDLGHSDAEAQILLIKAKETEKASKETVCDFGSSTIVSGSAYRVSIRNKDLNDDEDYIVEVGIGGCFRFPDGEVQKKGTMAVDLEPWRAGRGSISVFELKTKKHQTEKKLKAHCVFDVEAGATEGVAYEGGDKDKLFCNADSQCAPGRVCSDHGRCIAVPASCTTALDWFLGLDADLECGEVHMNNWCPGFNYTVKYGACEADEYCHPIRFRCESHTFFL